MTESPETSTRSERAGFWNQPAAWKVVPFVIGYLAFYLLIGQLVSTVFAGRIDEDNPLADGATIFFGVVLSVVVGAAALLVFAARQGWLSEIFGRQPVRGRSWMWVGPALVVAAIVAHVAAVDWGAWTGSQFLAFALLGASVGLAEELATRGVVVKMLRDARRSERFVAFVSSLMFALMHSVNLLTGQDPVTVLVTVVYTFGFGACMYLTMRVTGTIWAAIVLHGLTDPTTFLASGGLDKAVMDQSSAALTIASLATALIIVVGGLSLVLVKGRVADQQNQDAVH